MSKSSLSQNKQTLQLTVLQEVNELISSDDSTENILQAALGLLLRRFGYQAVQIYQLSTTKNDLWLYLEKGDSRKPVTQSLDIFSVEENNIISDAVREDRTILLKDAAIGRYSYFGDPQDIIGSEVAIPLKFGAEKLGVLRLQDNRPDNFNQQDLSFLNSLARLVAATIRNNRTISRLQDSIQEIKTLYSIQYQNTLENQHRRANTTQATGFEYSAGNVSKAGQVSNLFEANLPLDDDPSGIVTRQNNGTKELLAPIQLHNEIIGVLGLEDLTAAESDWTPEDISLLEEVTSQVALAIENARLLQQTREQTNELTILFEATRQLTETIDLQEIYDILTTQIANYINADHCAVLLLNKDRTHFETIVSKARHNTRLHTVASPRLQPVDTLTAYRRIIKQPNIIISHFNNTNLPADLRKYMSKDSGTTQTLTLFPLIVRNNLVGIMEVEHLARPHEYSKNELQLAQAIISQVTVAIENAQLFQQTQQSLEDTKKLYEISRRLVESTSVDDIFNIILENVKAYNVDRVSISLINRIPKDEMEGVTIVASWDKDPKRRLPIGTKFYSSNFSLVKAFAQPPFTPLVSHDLRRPDQDERMDDEFRQYALNQHGALTLFSAPMFLGNEYKGVISIYTRTPHIYSEQEIRIYQTLADQAIIAIENYRLLEATRLERDRTSLLYELGQALSYVTTSEQVQETVIDVVHKVGALDGELFITDGNEFVSLASTIDERQSIPTAKLSKIINSSNHEGLALSEQELVVLSKNEVTPQQWPLRDMLGMEHINALVAIPFFSQRSTLQGVVSFFHNEPNAFTDEQIATFESVAIQTAATLENVWLLRHTNTVLLETELLYNVTRGFNSAQSIEDILRVLADNMPETGVDVMSIALISELDHNNTPRHLDASRLWHKETDEITFTNLHLDAQEFSFIKNLRADSTTEISFTHLDAETRGNLAQRLNGVRSILAVPLTSGSNWLGVLLLASKQENYEYRTNAIGQLSTIAGQAAVVIKNIELVEETQKNLHNSEVLSNLGQQLLNVDSATAIYNLALNAIAATEPDRGAAIFMYDQIEDNVEIELTAVWDNPRQKWPTIGLGSHLSAEELGLTPLLKTGLTVISQNGQVDNRFTSMLRQLIIMMQIKALIAIPIWLEQDVAGFVLIGNHTTAAFPPETVRLYEDIARETSGALENRRLFDEAAHRAWQLQTAADISQAATAYLDLDSLLSESVELIKARFGFYHTSIFLVDDYQHYAIVRASTGEIGQKMLAMSHKLEVGGRSIVGTATGSGKPKIALDVGKDAVHFNNPLLPETRSEMALPLVAQGRVIGALDVQSTKRGAFVKSDIAVLQSMANQLANAIEAARAYQESKAALDEVSKLHQRYLTDQWSAYLSEQHVAAGYELADDGQIVPVNAPLFDHPDAQQLFQNKAPSVTQSLADSTDAPAEQQRLIAPLTLYGQSVIGMLDVEMPIESDESTGWNEDLLEIVGAVSAQAAQAIEAARLFEQSQVAREEAEALYEVGRSMVTVETETEMFNTVLGKMLSTLGLIQGGVLLFNEGRLTGRLYALYADGKPVEDPDVEFPIAENESYQELIASKQPVVIEDMSTDPRVARVREMGLVGNIASLLLVPIVINDEVIGAIGADAVGKIHRFTAREINLSMAMADQLSIALQNRRLIQETSLRANLLQTSSDVGQAATSILDEDVLIDQTTMLIADGFDFDFAQIYLLNTTDTNPVLRPHKYMELGLREQIEIGSQHVVGQAASTQKPTVVRGSAVPGTINSKESQLAIPLQVGGTLIGAISVHSSAPNAFADEEISTLETLSGQLSIAIQNARTFKEQEETAERLKEIDKLKTQFLANMSHELRTPLNSIIGFSRVILKGIDGPLTELQKADLTSIYNSGQHLLGLINNILDLSKIEAGKMELNFEETDLEPIIKIVMSTAIALVKDKPVELVQEVPEKLPAVWADATRIRQVILNLVSNATKFTDEGAIVTKATVEDNRVIISVTDTGIGIPEENLEHIFDEFTQVDGSTTRKVGGTGLGLPISRHFIEMHRGEIWVESKLGYGATFSFSLPTSPPSQNTGGSVDNMLENLPHHHHNRTIVAIDDDQAVIDLYRRYLKMQNYEVIGVTNGKEALAQVKRHAPMAVLLDIIIPDKDGWTIIKELKEDPFTKNIPVIVCSIVSDKNRGFSLGASNYLVKPIVENELIEAVKYLNSQKEEEIKVLVVDDHADDILLLRRILEAQPNYTIFEASNGTEGLELVKSIPPDLIILDLNMPKMDGFDMIEALKENEPTRSIPIIIVSAQELTTEEQGKLTGQVEVLLRKGIFTENELLQDVSQALEQINPTEKTLV